ncbi:MAG TPA: Gfo/Idh/MocA family oxidoreductase [Actinomycetales bacterium]|nr:Gfo/Idh/MocA family oxidoreductase [Actinomycetales bacterium]
MKIGVVGVGRIGTEHARTLHDHPDVELVVTDADLVRAEQVADKLGVPSVASVDELLRTPLDGLVIAAATKAHPQLICAGVDAGLPVFCEKPVASDVPGTRQVADHVRRAGGTVQVGFMRRFDPGYRTAREALRSGVLGELRRVHVVTADPRPPSPVYVPISNGIYRDLHIHDFDAVRWVTGREVREVFAMGKNRGDPMFARAGDVDEATTMLRLDDDTLVTMHGSRYNGAGYDVRMELAGTKDTWVVGLDQRIPLHSAEPGADIPSAHPWPGFWPRFTPAYRAEINGFVDLVRGGGESPCTVDDALAALVVAEAAARSRREHRPVHLVEMGS